MKQLVFGILAHVDSGKTTLAEAMLYTTGSIQKLGRVDRRDAFLDTFALERARGITIFSKQARLVYRDMSVTLLDTPGHVDFSAETERTLQVLDYAVLVISGTDGVQSHTLTLWNLLKKYGVPCFIFVNKMDMDGADAAWVLAQLRAKLHENCVDFTAEDAVRNEQIALSSEALLNEYDATGEIAQESIVREIAARTLFPCYFGSALKLNGVERLLQGLHHYAQPPSYAADFGAQVFKISEDAQGMRLTHVKITGGTLRVKDVPASRKNENGEKVNQIRLYSGDKFQTVQEAPAGTVCALTGISFASAGDGWGNAPDAALPLLTPVLTYRMELPEGADAHQTLRRMRLLAEEEPQLKVEWNERFGEIRLQLMGDIQLEVLQAMIAERFDLQVQFGKGSIIYKETIAHAVEGIGHFEPLRHYAEVHLLLKPAPRGSGIHIRSECSTDVLDKNWQRLIVSHLYEKTHIGALTGAPVTDMEIIVASGKAHPKHTEGGDFRQATYRAVRQGLRSAESILLEPIYAFVLEIPQENVGRALADIPRMHGTFEAPETQGEQTVIRGTAPVATMSEYSKEVVQYTHGKGSLSLTLNGYQPCHNAEEVIAQIGYDCDADTENTADSVFCSHGAGVTVKWDEVKSHMHLPSVLSSRKTSETFMPKPPQVSAAKEKNAFAEEAALMQIFEQTYGTIKPRRTSEKKTVSAPVQQPYKRQKKTVYDGKDYLLVDGYNVIHAWEDLRTLAAENVDAARRVLTERLINYRGWKHCEVILVFDAYKVKGNTRETEDISGVHIVYTKEAETADMYIEKATHQLAKSNRVRVVTSDALEQLIILGNGALRVSSQAFAEEMAQAEADIRALLNNPV